MFVLRRGNEEKKMNSFFSKEKLYITNLIWPPYNFNPSSVTDNGGPTWGLGGAVAPPNF